MTCIQYYKQLPFGAKIVTNIVEIDFQFVIKKMVLSIVNPFRVCHLRIYRYESLIPAVFLVSIQILEWLTVHGEMDIYDIAFFTVLGEFFQSCCDSVMCRLSINEAHYFEPLLIEERRKQRNIIGTADVCPLVRVFLGIAVVGNSNEQSTLNLCLCSLPPYDNGQNCNDEYFN